MDSRIYSVLEIHVAKIGPCCFDHLSLSDLLLLSPVIVVLWLLVKPLQGQWIGTAGFFAGTIYIGLIHGLNTWKYQRTPIESAPYRMLFGFVSIFVTLSVMLYGILTP